MDQRLFERFRRAAPPFAELTVAPEEMLPLGELRQVLGVMVEELRRRFGNEGLFQLADRHEHDGELSSATPVSWAALDRLLSADDRLYAARSGEVLVSLGFYPESLGFYLRAYVMEEDEDEAYPGRWGDFDLSGSRALIRALEQAVPAVSSRRFGTREASRYFRERSV